jgi:SlyX protein
MVDLELRFMQQERLTEDLNQVVIEQQRAIDRLTLEITAIRQQIRNDPDATLKDEPPPPHY